MDRIIIDSRVMHGKPVIRGTRIPVDVILGGLIGGMTYSQVEREYGVKKEDIIAAIEYASTLVMGEHVRPLRMRA